MTTIIVIIKKQRLAGINNKKNVTKAKNQITSNEK